MAKVSAFLEVKGNLRLKRSNVYLLFVCDRYVSHKKLLKFSD